MIWKNCIQSTETIKGVSVVRFARMVVSGRSRVAIILATAFLASVYIADWNRAIPRSSGFSGINEILRGFLQPDFSQDFLIVAIKATWTTITFGTSAIFLALVIAIPLSFVASGTLFRSAVARMASITLVRFILALIRSIHELIWAWLLAVLFGFSPITGVLALANPYSAILARVFSDFLNDVPNAPLRALRSSGASNVQTLLYGRIPMVYKDMLSYGFYRFECCLRSAAVLSFIGLQGIGYQIEVSMQDLYFGQVWVLIYFLIFLIVSVDWWGSKLRRSLAN